VLGRGLKPEHNLLALIDIRASVTGVNKAVLNRLGYPPIGVSIERQPYKVLLGRDVLSRMVMVYNGPQTLITLGY